MQASYCTASTPSLVCVPCDSWFTGVRAVALVVSVHLRARPCARARVEMRGSRPSLLPCVLAGDHSGRLGRSFTRPWDPDTFRLRTDRLSCSLVSRSLPYAYQGSFGGNVGGWVVSPHAAQAALLCSYPLDAASQNFACEPLGLSPTCTPGCAGASKATLGVSGWCGTPRPWAGGDGPLGCPWPPHALAQMLELHARRVEHMGCECCSYPGCVKYNELVLDAAEWKRALPGAIEAVYYPAGAPHAEADARRAHRLLLEHFSLSGAEVPLLALRLGEGDAPFRAAPPPPPPPTAP